LTGQDKSAYNLPTKAYRIQIRHKGMYYDEVICGQNDEDSIKNFFVKGFEGKIQPKDRDPIYTPDRFFCTIEEVNYELAKLSSKETQIGASVGATGTESKKSNT
jgi:hypothetical protein|tara:strand:+ start:15432 stop:15743 length:312 start_codon:yes stop_codon:yes gene_type:complete